MKILFLLLLAVPAFSQFTSKETTAWKKQAANVTIIRDTWGVPHIFGKSDADAVFGMLYAQCENDFERVELNYINNSGRRSEVDGEAFLYQDLRARLFMDSTRAISLYNDCPPWLKALCESFASGINYFLYTHPSVKPKLIRRFQPWMPLLFSEGSIGGDIESVSIDELKNFYGDKTSGRRAGHSESLSDDDARGSNGFAIAPSHSASGKALLLINPHTSFYFRTEIQIASEEGLNAYGAATWGQFFIYQGFNEHCGWMHTTSRADVVDEYKETVTRFGDSLFYQYGQTMRFLSQEKIQIAYRQAEKLMHKSFTLLKTHHGPVVAQRDGKWISVRMMNEPVKALTQSWQRIKTQNFSDFSKVMELRANSSNNTVYADAEGNIAYWHGNFMPIRDPKFDFSVPVDGTTTDTEWKGLHATATLIQLKNPSNGWIQNCNSSPFTAAGSQSPKKENFPAYMSRDNENTRALHAGRVLSAEPLFTLDKLIAAAYDSYLPAFESLLPSLLNAASTSTDLSEPVAILKAWDLRFSEKSIATTLAIFWAKKLWSNNPSVIPRGTDQLTLFGLLASATTAQQKTDALIQVINDLKKDFGTWKHPWGDINRFQRLTGNISPTFSDQKPSYAVPFTSSLWGSLASFESASYPNTKKLYGNVGNSFVAVVEFGDKVVAKSIVTGGTASDPSSKHFNDQSAMYCDGKFKDVFFYKADVIAHKERMYSPGQ